MVSESTRRSRLGRVALVFALSICAVRPALAEPTAADKETARSLLDQGDKKLAAGDTAGALAAYQGAHQIMGVPTTGIEVAKTEAALGKLVEARDAALEVARFPKAAGEPAAFTKARAAGEELAAKLAPRIASIHVVASGPPASAALKLMVDGTMVPAAASMLPRKVNPGPHTIVVGAEGFADATKDVTVKDGENADVQVALTPGASTLAPPPVDSATKPATSAPTAIAPPPPPAKGSVLVPIGLVVGAVGVAVGTVGGVISLGKTSSAKKHCTGSDCTPDAQKDIDSAKKFANLSNVGFGVGVIGVALLVVGVLSNGDSAPNTTATVKVPLPIHADFGLGSVSLSGRF